MQRPFPLTDGSLETPRRSGALISRDLFLWYDSSNILGGLQPWPLIRPVVSFASTAHPSRIQPFRRACGLADCLLLFMFWQL